MSFSEKLIELRRKNGLSQEQLGEKLGVTRQTVSKWELGATTPEMEKLAAISELFNISTDELIKGTAPEEAQTVQSFHNDKESNTKAINPTKLHYEYKSARTIKGIPLVHVNIGLGMYSAKGIIAIGNVAVGGLAIGLAAIGGVSIGFFAAGVIALAALLCIGIGAAGVAALGIFAAGAFACGVFSAGACSVGWLAVGGVAMGKYAIGGLANASKIALGGSATGIIAIGDATGGEIELTPPISVEEVRTLIHTRLPDTPRFIADIFVDLAQSLTIK